MVKFSICRYNVKNKNLVEFWSKEIKTQKENFKRQKYYNIK